MSRVKRAYLLKRIEVDIAKIKRGDLFCVELEGEPLGESPDWHVALVDSVPDAAKLGEVGIQAERVYLIVGKPEPLKMTLRKVEPPRVDREGVQ